jgi:hypothetical protein
MTTRRLLALCSILAAALAAPALAVDAPAAAPLRLGPASCGLAAGGPGERPEIPELAPEPRPRACTADLWCPDGCYIACQGNSLCEVGSTWIKCDGVQTNCPYPGCTPPTNCLDPCGYCDCRASGGTAWQCSKSFCIECWPPISCL